MAIRPRRRSPRPKLTAATFVHRTARLLRRIEAIRRNPLRDLCQARGNSSAHGAAVQQLWSGTENHGRAGNPRFRKRHLRGTRHSDALRWQSEAHLLLRDRRDHGLFQGAGARRGGEPYNIGIDRPEISIAELADLAVKAAADLFGYRGKVVLGRSVEADYLIDNPNRRCPAIDKARLGAWFRPEGIHRRRHLSVLDLVQPQSNCRGGLMKISIVGTGYVGLVTGACLAESGHDVVCVDVDPRKVDMINSARAPIHESGLPELLQRNAGRRLRASTDLAAAVAATELTFIAVGTPASGGKIDLKYVEAAASEIGAALRQKTELPRGDRQEHGDTRHDGRRRAHGARERIGKDRGQGFGLGMNPEFLTEGTAVADFSQPDRLVLGGIDARTHDVLARAVCQLSTQPCRAS